MEEELCYICGKPADYVCDFILPDGGGICQNLVCEEHSVPEFEDSTRYVWTLCQDHAKFQVKIGHSIMEQYINE